MTLAAQRSHDFVQRPRLQILYGVGGTLTLKAWSDNTQIVPSSATVNVKRPGGAPCTTPVADATVSIDVSGTMTYALTGGNADQLYNIEGGYSPWSAEWSYVVSGVTTKAIQLFDVVRFPLACVVRPDDLKDYHPDLNDGNYSTETTVQAYIDRAFFEIYLRICNLGKRPYLVLDNEQLRQPTEYLSLAKIFRARRKEKDDRWDALVADYTAQFDAWFAGQSFTYDRDDTGTVDPSETNRPLMQPSYRL